MVGETINKWRMNNCYFLGCCKTTYAGLKKLGYGYQKELASNAKKRSFFDGIRS
jgi:hypothetical protein